MEYHQLKKDLMECLNSRTCSESLLTSFEVSLITYREDPSISKRELEHLTQLFEKLRDQMSLCRPRTAFKFSVQPNLEHSTYQHIPHVASDTNMSVDDHNDMSSHVTSSNSFVVENKSNETILIDSCSESQDLLMRNIADSILIVQKPCSALHLLDLSHCIILISHVITSVLVNSCMESLVVIQSAHQIRIHESNKTLFLVESSSVPVIEKSRDLFFSSIPSSPLLPTSRVIEASKQPTIIDFDYLDSTKKSPHYNFISNEVVASFLNPNTQLNGEDKTQTPHQLIPSLKQLLDFFIKKTKVIENKH